MDIQGQRLGGVDSFPVLGEQVGRSLIKMFERGTCCAINFVTSRSTYAKPCERWFLVIHAYLIRRARDIDRMLKKYT